MHIYVHLLQTGLGLKKDDVVWATASPGWQKWIWSPFLAVLGSGAIGFVYNGKFEPNTYFKNIQEKKINVLCCTPTEYRIMAKVEGLTNYDLIYVFIVLYLQENH